MKPRTEDRVCLLFIAALTMLASCTGAGGWGGPWSAEVVVEGVEAVDGNLLVLDEDGEPAIVFVRSREGRGSELSIARRSIAGWSFRKLNIDEHPELTSRPLSIDAVEVRGRLKAVLRLPSMEALLIEEATDGVAASPVPCERTITGAAADPAGYFHLVGFDGRRFLYCRQTPGGWDVEGIPGEYGKDICDFKLCAIESGHLALDSGGRPHAVLPVSCACGETGCKASYQLVGKEGADWSFVEIPKLDECGSFFVSIRETPGGNPRIYAFYVMDTFRNAYAWNHSAGCYIWDGSHWSVYSLGRGVKLYPIVNSHVPAALIAEENRVRLAIWRDAGWGVWNMRTVVYRSKGKIASVCGAVRDPRGRLHVCLIEGSNEASRLIYIHPRPR